MSNILVIENDRDFATELRGELERMGGRVHVFQDARAGLLSAASKPPDLLIVSVELPRMNGFALCNRVKKDPNLSAVPVLLLSSDATAETFAQHQALPTKAQLYVHKPVVMDDLLRRVARLVPVGIPTRKPEPSLQADGRSTPAPPELDLATPAVPESSRPARPSRPPRASGEWGSSRPSSPPSGAARADRELLTLREALNARDRELLEVRERMATTERELLDSRDQTLEVERRNVTLGERLTVLDKELRDAAQRLETGQAAKALADQRATDFRDKADKAGAQLETRTQELRRARSSHAEQAAELHRKYNAELQGLDKAHRDHLRTTKAAHQKQLEKLEDARQEALQEAQNAHQEQAAALEQSAEIARTEAAAVRAEGERRDTDLRQAHANEVALIEERFAQDKQAALDELDERNAERVAELEQETATRADQIDHLQQRLALSDTEQKQQLEALRDEHQVRIEEIAQQHGKQLDELRSDRDSRIAELTEQHRSQDRTARAEFDERIDGVNRQHADALAELRKQHDGRVSTLMREHAEGLQTMRAERDGAVDGLTEEHRMALETARRDHGAKLDGISREHRAEVEALRLDNDTLREEHAEREGAHDAACEALRLELQRSVAEGATAIASATQRLDQELAAEQERGKQLTEQLETAREDADELNSTIEKLSANAELLTVNVEELTAEAAELTAARETALRRADDQAAELGALQGELSKARNRWGEDRSALEQARQTLSAVVCQLDEVAEAPALD